MSQVRRSVDVTGPCTVDAMKSYPSKSLQDVPPIEFEVGGETFRVPRRQRVDVQIMVSAAVDVVDGVVRAPRQTCINAIIAMVSREVWDGAAWVEVDDALRFASIVRSARVEIDDDTLGAIVTDLVQETTGHPTGASN